MSNGLHQLNAGYDPLQDRILFSLTTQDGTEFRFWITRRYLPLLWDMLGKLATHFAGLRSKGDPLAREALSEQAHHQAHQEADYRSAYTGGSIHPLGKDPILLAKVSLKQDAEGRSTLSLHPDKGNGADIGVDERVTHLIARLLQNAAVTAQWQLVLAPLAPTAMGEAASTQLH